MKPPSPAGGPCLFKRRRCPGDISCAIQRYVRRAARPRDDSRRRLTRPWPIALRIHREPDLKGRVDVRRIANTRPASSNPGRNQLSLATLVGCSPGLHRGLTRGHTEPSRRWKDRRGSARAPRTASTAIRWCRGWDRSGCGLLSPRTELLPLGRAPAYASYAIDRRPTPSDTARNDSGIVWA